MRLIIFIKKRINNPSDPPRGERGLIWAPLIIPGLVFRTPLSPPSPAWTEGGGSRVPVFIPIIPLGEKEESSQGKEISWLLSTLKLIQGTLDLEGTLEPWGKSGGLALNSSCVTFSKLLNLSLSQVVISTWKDHWTD